MDSYGKQIKKLKTVRAGALGDMVKLVDAVEGYHAALPRNRYAEKHSHAHFTEVMEKLEHSLRLSYYSYLVMTGKKRPSPPSLPWSGTKSLLRRVSMASR